MIKQLKHIKNLNFIIFIKLTFLEKTVKIILTHLINFIINLASVSPYKENDKISLLVFYETQGFVHDEAIKEGKVMMSKLEIKKTTI